MKLTDPEELLEVFDASGKPTGRARTRGEIHEEGLWHLAFFCWIVTTDGHVVLQKRASYKDVFPDRFDASAAGHVRFGETMAQAAREIEEELGLAVDPGELVPVMQHREEHRHESGLVDREIHEVHVLRCDRPLDQYRPGPEVTGLVRVMFRDLIELTERTRPEIPTTLVTFEGGRAIRTPLVLYREDLVPYAMGYLRAVALAAAALPPHSGRASIARR